MREIKFKFWNKRNNRWEDDPLATSGYYQNPFYNSDLIPCQFTGLLDKNGKEIFEGDILTDSWGNKGAVVWDLKTACFNKVGGAEWAEIIGNIYETPTLLSGSGQSENEEG